MATTPLYKRIQEDIKAQIAANVLREGDRVASESELRQHYFVSSITVKNALSGLVDEGIIYRLKGKGTFVAYSPFSKTVGANDVKTRTIGVVFPTLSTRVEQVYLVNIERACRENNCRVQVGISRESAEQEIHVVQDFINSGIHGLILFPTVSEINNAVVRQLVARQFPFIFMDRHLPDVPAPYVVSDNIGGTMTATEYLMSRCEHNIAICHFPLFNTAVSERVEGFCKAFEAAGGVLKPAHQCVINDSDLLYTSSELRIERLYGAMLGHLQQHRELRGLFATNVEIAQVAYLVLKRLGYTPGVDFELASFDNPHLPGVSFVQQAHQAMVQEAIQMLLRQMDGQSETGQLVIPTQFVRVPCDPTNISDMRHLITGLNPQTAQDTPV